MFHPIGDRDNKVWKDDLCGDTWQNLRGRGGELGRLDDPVGGTSNFRDWFQIGQGERSKDS